MDAPVTRKATLTRQLSAPDGTPGLWRSDSGFFCVTWERPDADNAPDVSCVIKDTYLVLWQWSQKHGKNLYHLQNVKDRTDIEIHAANVIEELLGCIAVGEEVAVFAKDGIRPGIPASTHRGVTNSVATLAKLEADMRDPKTREQVSFYLTIV
jgi:hypothetical protein